MRLVTLKYRLLIVSKMVCLFAFVFDLIVDLNFGFGPQQGANHSKVNLHFSTANGVNPFEILCQFYEKKPLTD